MLDLFGFVGHDARNDGGQAIVQISFLNELRFDGMQNLRDVKIQEDALSKAGSANALAEDCTSTLVVICAVVQYHAIILKKYIM